jgi:hypothetical protein
MADVTVEPHSTPIRHKFEPAICDAQSNLIPREAAMHVKMETWKGKKGQTYGWQEGL